MNAQEVRYNARVIALYQVVRSSPRCRCDPVLDAAVDTAIEAWAATDRIDDLLAGHPDYDLLMARCAAYLLELAPTSVVH